MGRLMKRAFRVLFWVVLGLVVIGGAVWLLRVPLFGGLVKGAITSRLSQEFGGSYSIDEVGGSWLSDFEIRGLRTVSAPTTGPFARLDVGEARVHYDLRRTLLGDRPLSGIEVVEVRGLRLDVDPLRAGSRAERAEPPDLALLDDFRGRVDVEGTVSVETGSGPAVLRDLRVRYGPMHVLDLDVGDVTLPERFAVKGPLAGTVNRIDDRTWRWTSDATFGEVRVPEATITTTGEVRGAIEFEAGRLEVTLAGRELVIRTEGIDLAQLPTWVPGVLPADAPELPSAGRVAGTATWAFDAPSTLSFAVAGRDVAWRDQVVTLFEIEGAWAGGDEIRLARLLARAPGIEARVHAALLDPRLPFLLREVADLSLEISSTKQFLPDLERDLAVSVQAAGSGRAIDLSHLSVVDADMQLTATGRMTLPEDPDAWRDTSLTVDVKGFVGDLAPLDVAVEGRLDVAGRLTGSLAALRGTLALTGEVRAQEIEKASLDATLRWPSLEVHRLQATAAGASLDVRGRLALDPFSVPELAGIVDVPDLARLAELVEGEVPALAGSLRADGRLRFSSDVLDVAADLTAADLRIDGTDVGVVSATVRSAERTLLVESLRAEGTWGRAHASGEILLDDDLAAVQGLLFETEDLSASLRAPLRVRWSDDAIAAEGLDVDVAGGRLMGDVVVRTEARVLDVSRLAWESDQLQARLAGPTKVAWSDSRLRIAPLRVILGEESDEREVRSNADLDVAVADGVATVTGIDVEVEGARLVGAGRVDLERSLASVDRLEVTHGDIDARLLAPATLRWPDGSVEISGLDLETFGGRITGQATLTDPPRAELEGSGFSLERFVPALKGELAFRARVEADAIAVVARVPELHFREWQGAFSLQARQRAEGGIEVVEARLTGPRGGAIVGKAQTPYRLSPEGLVRQDDLPSAFTLEGAIGGLSRFTDLAQGPIRLRAVGDDEGISAEVRVDDLGLCDEDALCDDGVARLRIDRKHVSATIAMVNDEFVSVRGRLALDQGFDWTRPATMTDIWERGSLDAELQAVVRSWGPLAQHLPGVRRLEGGAGVTLRAKGRVTDPRIRGDIRLSDFTYEGKTVLAPLEQVDAHLVWEDRGIRIEKLEGMMGYAPFSIGGSVEVALGQWPSLDVTLKGRNMQLLRTDYLRMRIDVDAAAKGPLNALAVTGEGTIVDFLYRKPVSLSGAATPGGTPEILLFKIRNDVFSEMTFDVGVKARDNLRIRNNFLRMNASYEGRLRGTGGRPEFEGRLWFRGGEVFLPVTTLRRADGEVVFTKEAPFRPRLQMTAQTRTRGYEMGVQVAGALPDVNLYVFTEPRLDDEDAILMLTTGSTGAELSEGGIGGKAISVLFSLFGGSLVTSRAGDGEPGEKAFFERFEFTSDWQGTRIQEIDGEFELTDRFFLKLRRDRFEQTNLGLLWRVRFR